MDTFGANPNAYGLRRCGSSAISDPLAGGLAGADQATFLIVSLLLGD